MVAEHTQTIAQPIGDHVNNRLLKRRTEIAHILIAYRGDLFRFQTKCCLETGQREISNGFSDYSIKISQPEEETIFFETFYMVKPGYAPATNAKDVQEVFEAIKNLNVSSLKFKTQ